MVDDVNQSTVLVVDDDRELADLYASWLQADFDVQAVYSGEAALEAMHDTRPDVVLLDRRMPDFSGDQVLVTLRDWGIDARVAMVTAKRPRTDFVDLGFDEYLLKPIDSEPLVDTVHRLASRRSFDTVSRDLSSLRVKRNVLEIECSREQLAMDEQYQSLVKRIEKLAECEAEYRGDVDSTSPNRTQRCDQVQNIA